MRSHLEHAIVATGAEIESRGSRRMQGWLESPEGRQWIETKMKDVRAHIAALNDLQRIDPRILEEPVTI